MKRGFVAAGPVIASCSQCDTPYGPCRDPRFVFWSVDEAMDYFVDGTDGWELYGDRLMCPDCLPLSPCYNPGHDWHTSMGAHTGGGTLVTHQCAVCGLYLAEVLA